MHGAMQGHPEVQQNEYIQHTAMWRLPRALATAATAADCFDCAFYAAQNSDLGHDLDCLELFAHYVNSGQFESRPMRCDAPLPLQFAHAMTLTHLTLLVTGCQTAQQQ